MRRLLARDVGAIAAVYTAARRTGIRTGSAFYGTDIAKLMRIGQRFYARLTA